ncbi:hypothetical protein F4556_004789 [Kitasatospora gansuensis]|uniref:Uncharacterized protein n=1 Tax=Kitasatospora gansuensis TaxID=258050 RepID=A0A7W7SF08_9ACTN|nr:DUF6099 family protein [Kitasatospora gansuensis]MBB4949254.1 hypothetical protein [Kitasatospora gansuensis]
MDALRLIKTARHALAEARSASDALVEAWQAGLLTEAVGAGIAGRESGELAALGQMLCDAGAHAVSCLEEPSPAESAQETADAEWHRADWGGNGRAARLDELGELEPVLTELGLLLHDMAEALVVLACGADGESLYWRCIDGVDAGSECKDVVVELLRTLRREAAEAAEREPETTAEPGRGAVTGAGPAESQGVPTLVVPLGPPATARGGQPRPADSVDRSSASRCSPVRPAEDCRSASSPARLAFRSASMRCICSSRVPGEAAGAGASCCGVTGASDQGSDMSGPLQLGSAV